jgi:D-sedoheptulose 7-phosphate isomerase
MNLNLSSRIDNFKNTILGAKVFEHSGAELFLENELCVIKEKFERLKELGSTLYIIGNGGSAAIASHAATDFFNVAKIKATTLHETSLLTCLANDYGYENIFSRVLEQSLRVGDILVAISSSGNSLNIRNAVNCAVHKNIYVVTLTGFKFGNPLMKMGNLNIWLNTQDYGMAEVGHQFILHNIADRFNNNLPSN